MGDVAAVACVLLLHIGGGAGEGRVPPLFGQYLVA